MLSFSFLQLCQFTAPVPHLAVYTGTCDPPSPFNAPSSSCHALSDLPLWCSRRNTLPNSTSYPSPLSVAPDSTSRMGRYGDAKGSSLNPFPSITENMEITTDSESGTCHSSQNPMTSENKLLPKSRMNMSLGRFLKRGCLNSPVFATLSPKCPLVMHGKVQPLDDLNQQLQQSSKKVSNFFQIKMDAPLESKIHPIESEEEEESSHWACKGSAKEVICPWENLSEEGKAA